MAAVRSSLRMGQTCRSRVRIPPIVSSSGRAERWTFAVGRCPFALIACHGDFAERALPRRNAMKQRLMFGTALFLCLALAGAVAEGRPDRAVSTPYVHVVIFRLKKDAPRDAVERVLADCHRMLSKIQS